MARSRGFVVCLLLVGLVLAACCVSASCAVVYVKWDSPNDGPGNDWSHAYHTVSAGLIAAAPGDEVWVAAGTYEDSVMLSAGVSLYGGFGGAETLREQRNWTANDTILRSGHPDIVTSPPAATSTTKIDGFTITNGSSGINCTSSAPTITNNTIRGNGYSGILCSSSSPTIANNLITGNDGPGIRCFSSSPTITNNTIMGNNGDGIWCQSSSPAITNNIVAFNFSGIYKSSGSPTLLNNDVYGNTSYNYAGLSAGAGSISSDPLLASTGCGNLHIQPGSPCKNAGWNGAAGLQVTDMDAQPRVQDGTVDIGADESDGTVWVLPGPDVTITAPTQQPTYLTNAATVDLVGTAVGCAGVATVTWSTNRGGSGTCSGTTSWSAAGVPLVEGDNLITVTAQNAQGVSGVLGTLLVTRDTVAPGVAITAPTASATYSTNAAAVAISGTADDANGISSVTWTDDRGGSGTCSGTTSWSTNVSLTPEANLITVTAHDKAGNTVASTLLATRLPITVGAARQAPVGSSVFISKAVVTANSLAAGTVFVESSDRSAGLMVVTNEPLSPGKQVKCSGTLGRVNGEYRITGATFQEIVDGTALSPLFMTTRTICSDPTETLTYSMINTTGLLVRTYGRVTGVITGQEVAYLDDGWNYQDIYGPVVGLRFHVGTGVSTSWNNQRICVTGISRVTKFTLSIWVNVNGDWYPPGTVLYVPYVDALAVDLL